MRTVELIRTASRSVAYNDDAKSKFHEQAEVVLHRLAKLLGYKADDYDLRHNEGGIAVSGEITLHSDTLYVQFFQSAIGSSHGFMWRTCKGRKDYCGNRNQWCKWEELRDLKTVADAMKAEVGYEAFRQGTGGIPIKVNLPFDPA